MTQVLFCGIIYKNFERRTEVIVSTELNYTQREPCVVALGCFDGVHLGHTAVINQAKEKADSLNVPLCIWSFAEPPKRFYAKETVHLLSSAKSKAEIIEMLGADVYISVKFNANIAAVTAEDFFNNILIKNLNCVAVVCGYDFTFGKGGCGNAELLSFLCKSYGIDFIPVQSVNVDGEAVSSSRIRGYILNAEIERANKLLGRPYSIVAEIIDGKHLGRNLGFPTINQRIDENLCKPANGVYLTRITLDDACYFGITNVGTQPTVCGRDIIVETNIFDISANLYGKEATVEFLKFIRPERKFNTIDELKTQVNRDIATAKAMAAEYKKSTE